MSLPRVSVLTPCLNYARFLDDAIESVALQEAVELEHVIQDGASSDGTVELLRSSARPLAWVSQPDRGQSDALNRALARATGEWVGWLNADEFYLPGALRILIDSAISQNADVVHGDTVFVDENGCFQWLMCHHGFDAWYLRWYGCYFASCSTIFRRDVLIDAGWDESYQLALDWDLYLRLHQTGARISYTRYPVGGFRLHDAQVIAREHDFDRDFGNLERAHGVRPRWQRRLGRLPHDLRKLRQGAYAHQLCARSLRGRDMRWFAHGGRSGDATRYLLSNCYQHRSKAVA